MATPIVQPATPGDSLRGISLLVAAVSIGTINDAIVKLMTGAYPVGQILFVRGVFVLAIPVAWLVWRNGGLGAVRVRNWQGQAVRAGAMVVSTYLFNLGLALLPLASVIAITYAGPLFITALAYPLLREAVGWRRWSAVGVGFLGILMIVQPGDRAFAWAALVPLGATLFGALKDIVTRRISVTETSPSILVVTTVAVTLAGLATAPFGWAPLAWADVGLMAVAGVLVGLSHYLQIEAFRLAEAAVVAPFKYTTLLWAILFGFVLWGEVPGAWTLGGSAVVIASGLYILHRERVRRRTWSARPASF